MNNTKPLSRKRARASIILIAVGLIPLFLGAFIGLEYISVAGLVLILSAAFVRPSGCKECGKTVYVRPQWGAPGKFHCPHCGARMMYDDEPEAQDPSDPPS